MDNRPIISWSQLGDFMTTAFEAVGVPHDDALICSDVLMESDRRGIESHEKSLDRVEICWNWISFSHGSGINA